MQKPKLKLKKGHGQIFVGLDVHKKSIQAAVMDESGMLLRNTSVKNTDKDVRKAFEDIPKDAKCVMESSSVWYGLFRFISDDLKRDVMLSNPPQTHAIAASKKKSDKIDARILADLLRGGYISGCHVPEPHVMETRQIVRYRARAVQSRTRLKNSIHGILLQERIQMRDTPFSTPWIAKIRRLKDFRLNGYLNRISYLNNHIAESHC